MTITPLMPVYGRCEVEPVRGVEVQQHALEFELREALRHVRSGRLRQVAGADLRAFDVHHHRQLLLQAKADFADAGDDGAHPGVVGVRHVQADDVRAGPDDGLQLGFGLGRRPDGESDAGVAEWLHVFYE